MTPAGAESRVGLAGAGKAVSAPIRVRVERPNVVENGSNLILFPYAGFSFYDPPQSVAFTPDGDAYFGDTDNSNTIVRLSPDGTYTKLSVPFAGSNVIYAHGSLWTGAYDGVVSFSPDGTKHRDYYLGARIEGLASGNQGSIYAIAYTYNATTKVAGGKLFRVGGNLPKLTVSLPVYPLGPLALGADGLPYFSYENVATGAFGIARVESNGATTLFPIMGYGVGVQAAYPLVLSNGSLYFTFLGQPSAGPAGNQIFGRISTSGVITALPLAMVGLSQSVTTVSTLSVDRGGNIWTILGPLANGANNGLFLYNVYTGRYSGPYATAPYAADFRPGPFVGPDDNVYFFIRSFSATPTATFAAFVTHVQTLEPASLSLESGTSSAFTILETHSNGPWTAQSLNPSVATVAPASSTTGTFTVTQTGPGMTSVAVKDSLGNISYELVTSL